MSDPIKEAFTNIKQEIDYLYYEIEEIKRTLHTLKDQLDTQQTIRQQTDTPSTDNLPLEASKTPNLAVSSGSEGVSTDRQTDKQTLRQPPYFLWKPQENNDFYTNQNTNLHINEQNSQEKTQEMQKLQKSPSETPISTVLDTLDDLKEEVRIKFKKLTTQEMLVFSTIYELEEQGFIVDYSILSQHLTLTESSIRDYVQRLIKKGIPLKKNKENNKKITLKISQELKQIASLDTLQQLRTSSFRLTE